MAKNFEISLLLDFYGDMLTEKQRSMLDYYYNNDLSLSEIAGNEGITRQGVRDAIQRAQAQLVEMEEKLKLVQKFKDMRRDLEEIYNCAKEIDAFNDRYGYSREINDRAKKILGIVKKLFD